MVKGIIIYLLITILLVALVLLAAWSCIERGII